jgi:hypothetical protein
MNQTNLKNIGHWIYGEIINHNDGHIAAPTYTYDSPITTAAQKKYFFDGYYDSNTNTTRSIYIGLRGTA